MLSNMLIQWHSAHNLARLMSLADAQSHGTSLGSLLLDELRYGVGNVGFFKSPARKKAVDKMMSEFEKGKKGQL